MNTKVQAAAGQNSDTTQTERTTAELEIKREAVRASYRNKVDKDHVELTRGLPSLGDDEKQQFQTYLKKEFVHAAYSPVIRALLTEAPLIVWQTWNSYMTVAMGEVATPAYAQNLLDLAREFSRAAGCKSDLTRFQAIARTRDAWPGFTSKLDILRGAETKKRKKLGLSSAHRSVPLDPKHDVTVQLVGSANKAHDTLFAAFADAPPVVQRTSPAYFQLAASQPGQSDYPDLILHLACDFVAAVDPSTATGELLHHFQSLSKNLREWPGWLTRPKFAQNEMSKLRVLPLGTAWGTKKVEATLNVPAMVAERLLEALRQISQSTFHGDRCVPGCDVTTRLKLPCSAQKCPWRENPRPSRVAIPPRFFWDFHELSVKMPPLDSDPNHIDIWLAVAGRLLDSEHGPSAIRDANRNAHYRGFMKNPRVLPDSISRLGFRLGEPCEVEEWERFGQSTGQVLKSEHSIGKSVPYSRSESLQYPSEGPPFALAYPHVAEFCRTAVDKGVKSDAARYEQFRLQVMEALRIRLPKPKHSQSTSLTSPAPEPPPGQ